VGAGNLVGSALLQQLDLDCLYEDWRPPAQLIDKRDLRGVPRHGIGRSCKVGKEQIVGLLAALIRFTEDGDAARYGAIAQALAAALGNAPGLRARVVPDLGHGGLPLVEVAVSSAANRPTATQLATRLRAATHPFTWMPRTPTRAC
jgi:L-seryl-tRNA(Ser) seleniumtransferase